MYSSFVEGLLNLPDLAYACVTAQAAARRADRPTDETDEPPRALQRRRGNNDGEPMEADDASEENEDPMAVEQRPLAAPVPGATAGAIVPAQAVEGSGEGAAPRLRSYARTLANEQEAFGVAAAASEWRLVVVDFEATGKAIKFDEPIQLAFRVLGAEERQVWYAVPNVEISAGAHAIHRISKEELELMEAEPLVNVLNEVVAWLTEVSGGRPLAFVQHGRFDVQMLVACLQRYSIDTTFLDNVPVLDTLACAKDMWHLTDLIDNGYSLQKLYKFVTRQPLEGAHDADVDVGATIVLAARLFSSSDCDSADAFLTQYARRYAVPVALAPVAAAEEDDFYATGGLFDRMGPEGFEVIAAARREGRVLTLDQIFDLAYAVPANRSFEHSNARQRLRAALDARSGATVRPVDEYERARPHGAKKFAQPGWDFDLPDDKGTNEECAAAFEARYAEYYQRTGFYLRGTEARRINFKDPVHRHIRRKWFRKWKELAGGDGRRPWFLRTLLKWNRMVEVMTVVEGAEFGEWLREFDEECRELARASSPTAPLNCEHCASFPAAVEHARSGVRGAPGPASIFRDRRYVRFDTVAAAASGIRGGEGLLPDHIKGTPILRCWACPDCNGQLTDLYDSAYDVHQTLTNAADASEASVDHFGVTRAGPA